MRRWTKLLHPRQTSCKQSVSGKKEKESNYPPSTIRSEPPVEEEPRTIALVLQLLGMIADRYVPRQVVSSL